MNYRSQKWLRAVAELPCVICGRYGETQAAHRNVGKGIGMKTDDCLTAALCQTCHHMLDNGKSMTREERRAAMDTAIVETLRLLVLTGAVKV